MKAIEAAALAWAEHERNGFCMSADGKRRLTIAIRAYLTALSEDDAAVEKVADALKSVAPLSLMQDAEGLAGLSDALRRNVARAAIRAMGGDHD